MGKEFIIELTNRCNNACLHCSSECKQIEPNEISSLELEDLKGLTDILKENCFETIVYSGGEPFLYNDLVDLTNHYKENGFKIKIYTSGNFIQNYSASLYHKIDVVVFSIHSCNKENHNLIAGNPIAYENLISNFHAFKNNDIEIEVNLVPLACNLKDICKTYFRFENFISKFNILKLVKQGNAVYNWNKISYNHEALQKELFKLKNLDKVRIGNSFNEISNCFHYCDAGNGKICLTHDGYLIPCEVFKDRRSLFPNMLTQSPNNVFDVYSGLSEIKSSNRGCLAPYIFNELFPGEFSCDFQP